MERDTQLGNTSWAKARRALESRRRTARYCESSGKERLCSQSTCESVRPKQKLGEGPQRWVVKRRYFKTPVRPSPFFCAGAVRIFSSHDACQPPPLSRRQASGWLFVFATEPNRDQFHRWSDAERVLE